MGQCAVEVHDDARTSGTGDPPDCFSVLEDVFERQVIPFRSEYAVNRQTVGAGLKPARPSVVVSIFQADARRVIETATER